MIPQVLPMNISNDSRDCFRSTKFAEKARSGGGLDLGSCISMLPAFCANPCYTAMSDAFSPELAVLSAIM